MLQTVDDQLLDAIESGNLSLVSQLMNSGLGINTIFFSTKTNERMSVLSLAAHENQVEIVKYLLENLLAPVNYRDSLLRSALHWSCISNSFESAKILLKGHAEVNACDRDNVTPIIFAAMVGSVGLTRLLIDNGAKVSAKDRSHSTALHYSTFHGKREITHLLIKGGNISNERIVFGQGTPLANLTYHSDFENITCLIEAGYDMSHDSWIPQYEKHVGLVVTSPDIASYLKFEYFNPSPLRRLCRASFRNHFNGIALEKKINNLSIPNTTKMFLLLDEVD